MDNFKTLGVERDATDAEIKKAYRKLSSIHHPDKGGDEEKFKKIKTAYEAIKDEDARDRYNFQSSSRYDRYDKYGDDMDWGNIKDVWAEQAKRWSRRQHDPFAKSKYDDDYIYDAPPTRISMSLSLDSVLHTQDHVVKLTDDSVRITVPAGLKNKETIKYTGAITRNDKYNSKSDLIVTFAILPHRDFTVVDDTVLQSSITIDAFDAMIGTVVDIKTIDGAVLRLKIPAGTQPGTKFKIPGRGMLIDRTEKRGDMFVIATITIPTLTEDEINTIQKLREK